MPDTPWLNTATGGAFFLPPCPETPREPVPEHYQRAADGAHYDIVDIAIALGHQARYAGHTRRHYSVAEHSLLVAEIALAYASGPESLRAITETLEEAHGPGFVDGLDSFGPDVARVAVQYALLHDAAEAYCTDVPWPLIMAGLAPELQLFDRAVSAAIVRQFMGGWPRSGIKRLVKYVDVELIDIESQWVLYKRHPLWESRIKCSELAVKAWSKSALFGCPEVSGGGRVPALEYLYACVNYGLATEADIARARSVLFGQTTGTLLGDGLARRQ